MSQTILGRSMVPGMTGLPQLNLLGMPSGVDPYRPIAAPGGVVPTTSSPDSFAQTILLNQAAQQAAAGGGSSPTSLAPLAGMSELEAMMSAYPGETERLADQYQRSVRTQGLLSAGRHLPGDLMRPDIAIGNSMAALGDALSPMHREQYMNQRNQQYLQNMQAMADIRQKNAYAQSLVTPKAVKPTAFDQKAESDRKILSYMFQNQIITQQEYEDWINFAGRESLAPRVDSAMARTGMHPEQVPEWRSWLDEGILWQANKQGDVRSQVTPGASPTAEQTANTFESLYTGMGDLTGQIDRATQAIAKLSEQDAPERVGEWRSMAQAYEVIPPEGMTLEEVPEVGMKSMILEAMTANRDRLMRMRESQAARIEGIERTGASTRNTYGDRGWTYYGGNQTGASGGYSADQQSGFEAMWESATPGERNEMRRRYQAGESKEQIMSTVAPPEQSVAPPVQESGPMSVPASPLPGLGGEGYTPAPQPQRLEETPTFSDETTVTGSSPFLGKLASRRPIPDPAAMQGVDVTRLPGGGPMQNYTGGRDQGVTTESLPFGYSAPEPTSEILLKRPARFWGDLASRGIEAIGSAGEAVGDFLRGGKPEGMSYREYEMMLQQQAARPGDPSFMGPLQPPRERFPVTAENLGISGGPQPMPSGEQMLQNVGEFMDPLTSRIPTQDEIWTGTVGQNPAILGPGRTPRHTPLTQPQQGGAVDVPIVSEGVGLLSGVNVDRPAPPTAASPPGTGDVGLLRGQNAYQPADSPPVPADQQALITDPAAVSQVGAEQTPSGMLTQLLQQLINSGRVGEPALDEAVNAPRQILASQTQRFTPDVYDKQSFAETTGPPREFGIDPALMDAIRGVTIEGNPVVRDDWEPFIQEAAQATGLDPMMIASVIGQESSFKDDQVSKAGAVGPMQVMEGAAQDVGVPWELVKVSDRWNIMAGAMYLKHLLDNQAQGDIGKALTMYNYGPSWWDTPNPKTGMTRDYLGNKEAREYSPGVMDWARRISGTGGG